jgi:hypothetical protein
MLSRVYKALPKPSKIHPAWRHPAPGENPLRLPPPINKDNIRRWKRIHQCIAEASTNQIPRNGPLKKGVENAATCISKMAVEAYVSYARKCAELNTKVGYAFKQFLPYILYQMRHGLSVPLYTPKIGVKHSTVPMICIIPKVELMEHLPPPDMFSRYSSVTKHVINIKTLSRMQTITNFLIEMYVTTTVS